MGINQFTTLSTSLLVILCSLLVGAILTAVLLWVNICSLFNTLLSLHNENTILLDSQVHPFRCVLEQRQGKKLNIDSYSDHNNEGHPLQQIRSLTQPLPVPSNEVHENTNTIETQAYSYPTVHTIAGRRVIPNTGRGSNQVCESANNSGRMSSATGQHTESFVTEPIAVEASFSYDSNPAYRGNANENFYNNELYLSIRQETTEPSGGASAHEPV